MMDNIQTEMYFNINVRTVNVHTIYYKCMYSKLFLTHI